MFCHVEIVTLAAKIIWFLNIDYFAFKTEFGWLAILNEYWVHWQISKKALKNLIFLLGDGNIICSFSFLHFVQFEIQYPFVGFN